MLGQESVGVGVGVGAAQPEPEPGLAGGGESCFH